MSSSLGPACVLVDRSLFVVWTGGQGIDYDPSEIRSYCRLDAAGSESIQPARLVEAIRHRPRKVL